MEYSTLSQNLNEQITKEWEENMKNFKPDDFVTVEIEEGGSFMF